MASTLGGEVNRRARALSSAECCVSQDFSLCVITAFTRAPLLFNTVDNLTPGNWLENIVLAIKYSYY
jgi:hypothetical protein